MMEINKFSAQQHVEPIGVNTESNEIFSKLFGPPLKAFEPDPYDKQSYTHRALPDIFRDKARLIREAIDGFIVNTPEENFYTQVLLPWQQTPVPTVEWNQWKFDGGIAEQVPHEGVSRLLTSQKTKHKRTIVRRGIAFKMEGDLFNTQEGVAMYRRNIKGIANTVKETQDYDTIVQLLLVNTYEEMWHARYRSDSIPLEKVFEEEIETYAAITFDEKRLPILYEQSRTFMARDGVSVSGGLVLVVTPGSQIYLRMVGPSTDYYIGGPDGPKRLKGPRALAEFPDGTKVFELRDFNVDSSAPPFQPATRRMAIAEFYQMYMNPWRYEDLSKNFQSKHRDTIIYDETKDSWQRIHFMDAFINCRIFGKDGDYSKALKKHVGIFNENSHMDLDGEHGKPSPHFLSAQDNDGGHFLVKYFGQMTGDREHFIQMGQTLMGSILGDDIQDALGTWDDILCLIDEIESQEYNHDYWLELIKVNEQASIDKTGKFIGHRTPSSFLNKWGSEMLLREWTPNTTGSLNLPDGNKLNGVDFPAGFANYPGLLTLAKEAVKETSFWNNIGKRARKGVDLIHKLVDRCKLIVPTSAAINPKHQPPWFHRDDAGAVFVANIVSVNRPPIWIAALKPMTGADGNVRGGAFGKEDKSEDQIPWRKRPNIPLFFGEGIDIHDITKLVQSIEKGEFEIQKLNYEYISPMTGTNVVIPYAQLAYSALLPKELMILLLMGTKSSVKLMQIFQALKDFDYPELKTDFEKIAARRDMINKTLSILYGYALAKKDRIQLRTLVRGIGQNWESPERLIETTRTIYTRSGASDKEMKASRTMITRLTRAVREESETDEDILAIRNLSDIYPPTIKRIMEGVGSEVSEPGGVAMKSLEPDFEAYRDAVLELNLLSLAMELDPIELETILPDVSITDETGALADRFNVLVVKLKVARGRILDQLPKEDETLGEEENLKIKALRDSFLAQGVKRVDKLSQFSVVDDEAAAMRSRFYRSPLTMSLDLLESLSRAGQSAFIRPSDPSTGHTSFYYELQKDANDDMETTLPGALWKRPEFARVSDFLDSKQLEHITFISKEIKTQQQPSRFDDSDDEDDYDNNDSKKRKSSWKISSESKRRKTEGGESISSRDKISFPDDYLSDDEEDIMGNTFGVGSRATRGFRDPSDGWDKRTLREPGGGVDVRRPFRSLIYSDKYNKIVTDTFASNYRESNDISNPLLRAMVQTILFTKSKGDQWIKMIKNDVLVPINILLWRPTIAHYMDTFILMKPGLETGANLYRDSNFATGNDITSKIILGHYTFYSKAIIWEPRNVTLLENLKPNGYCGGNNTEFMDNQSELINSRSCDKYRKSIISTALPLSEKDPKRFMDLTGYTTFQPGLLSYSTAEFYSDVWGITNMDNHMDGKYNFFDKGKKYNYTALQGFQYLYNRSSESMNRIIEAQGHRKKTGSYPGAAPIWNGIDKFHKSYNFESVRLE